MNPENKPRKGVDIEKLVKEHPNDPSRGQGYNSARGEVEEDVRHPQHHNIKNNLGPLQKRRRPLARVAPPQTSAGYTPRRKKS
jgi:hypothetical protein